MNISFFTITLKFFIVRSITFGEITVVSSLAVVVDERERLKKRIRNKVMNFIGFKVAIILNFIYGEGEGWNIQLVAI